MANEIIKAHNFVKEKNALRALLPKNTFSLQIKRFPTEGSIFSCNEHNVTGNEINSNLVSPLQSALVRQNTNICNLYAISNRVYNTIEFLDKEYTAGILKTVEAARIASNQATGASLEAKKASKEALNALKAAQNANNDNRRTINALNITVQSLKKFQTDVSRKLKRVSNLSELANSKKSSVSESIKVLQSIQPYLKSLAHIKDIDIIWNNLDDVQNEIIRIIDNSNAFGEKINQLEKYFSKSIEEIEELIVSIEHLSDIDIIWEDVESHNTDLAEFHHQVDTFIENVNHNTTHIRKDIKSLYHYRSKLEQYNHLSDIDKIWRDVDNHRLDLLGLHRQVDTFIEEVNQSTKHIHKDIDLLQKYRSKLEKYTHLSDIDTIWQDVNNHRLDLLGLHRQVDTFIEEIRTTHSEIRTSIATLEEANIQAHVRYEKRIKIAYYVGGTALGLSIINCVFYLMGLL